MWKLLDKEKTGQKIFLSFFCEKSEYVKARHVVFVLSVCKIDLTRNDGVGVDTYLYPLVPDGSYIISCVHVNLLSSIRVPDPNRACQSATCC